MVIDILITSMSHLHLLLNTPACFTCSTCEKMFKQTFIVRNGRPYHQEVGIDLINLVVYLICMLIFLSPILFSLYLYSTLLYSTLLVCLFPLFIPICLAREEDPRHPKTMASVSTFRPHHSFIRLITGRRNQSNTNDFPPAGGFNIYIYITGIVSFVAIARNRLIIISQRRKINPFIFK